MNYRLKLSKKASRELGKLDRFRAKMILNWLKENVDGCADPRHTGKSLKGRLREYWRYRVGNYRVICDIQDEKLVVLAVSIGDRKDVYE
jgi:mRNA interferase RelE/StbE